MSNIELLNKKFQDHFDMMTSCSGEEPLFIVDLDKNELWDIYLNSFPEGTNPIYRVRREYDCSCCRQFIKQIGNVVWIDSYYNIRTMFDFDAESDIFQPVMNALHEYVKDKPIIGKFFTKYKHIGCKESHEYIKETGAIKTFNHLFIKDIPIQYVFRNALNFKTIPEAVGASVTDFQVFERSLEDISTDALETVIEISESGTLYRGKETLRVVKMFRDLKRTYETLSTDIQKSNFCWKQSAINGPTIARIRNHAIGVLLTDISNGMDLDQAVRRYEAIMAPSNYKRPKPIFTKKMVEDAEKTVRELGYLDSLGRRFATLDDIRVNNILFANKDATKRVLFGRSIFDEMKEEADIVDPKRFSRVDSISIENFISTVLPHAKEVEVLFENKHTKNLVSLIAPKNPEAKSMFKWNNGFSWAYTGNQADSDIRENVKAAGGKVEGFMRFSIQWNDKDEWDRNDLDAHCFESIRAPKGGFDEHIMFSHKYSSITGGSLDIDIINPVNGKAAVENIIYEKKEQVRTGTYTFGVHCYTNRQGKSGFRAELEIDGKSYFFDYDREVRQNELIKVAQVKVDTDVSGHFVYSVETFIEDVNASKDIWGLKTNKFIPATVIMYSPNYWDEQTGIGNRHYMFMLSGCKNPDKINGFYNEFLKNELNPHRRVFEALGSKMAVEESDDQLSGLGFSDTRRDDLIVKVKGATERTLRIIL